VIAPPPRTSAAPEDFAPLEHCGLEAALGQIKCGDQCVVTATD